jgi:acyl-CoA synthetase (AMP-forming)/AMP-acid ligase II
MFTRASRPDPSPRPPAENCPDARRRQIAGYKLPRSVAFAGALPISGAGKVLKRELRKPYWDTADRNVS